MDLCAKADGKCALNLEERKQSEKSERWGLHQSPRHAFIYVQQLQRGFGINFSAAHRGCRFANVHERRNPNANVQRPLKRPIQGFRLVSFNSARCKFSQVCPILKKSFGQVFDFSRSLIPSFHHRLPRFIIGCEPLIHNIANFLTIFIFWAVSLSQICVFNIQTALLKGNIFVPD